MFGARSCAWLFALGAFVSMACGGESSSSDGDDSGGSGGTGGSLPDGTCDDIVPCGGDPTGTWIIRENCLEAVVPGLFEGVPGCENVHPVGSGTLEGTFTFENGVATQSTAQTVDVTVVIDDACAAALSMLPGVSAAALCPLLDAMLMMDPMTPADCAAVGADCRCDATQITEPTVQTDSYEVTGDQLVLGSGDAFDFCQQGDEMSLSGETVDAMSGATAEILVLLDRE
ncbi:MAG TPA: hypothetical protein VFZ53_15365 [Polyangiaceae bacterium]